MHRCNARTLKKTARLHNDYETTYDGQLERQQTLVPKRWNGYIVNYDIFSALSVHRKGGVKLQIGKNYLFGKKKSDQWGGIPPSRSANAVTSNYASRHSFCFNL